MKLVVRSQFTLQAFRWFFRRIRVENCFASFKKREPESSLKHLGLLVYSVYKVHLHNFNSTSGWKYLKYFMCNFSFSGGNKKCREIKLKGNNFLSAWNDFFFSWKMFFDSLRFKMMFFLLFFLMTFTFISLRHLLFSEIWKAEFWNF